MTLPISAAARCAALCVILALAGTAKGQLVNYSFGFGASTQPINGPDSPLGAGVASASSWRFYSQINGVRKETAGNVSVAKGASAGNPSPGLKTTKTWQSPTGGTTLSVINSSHLEFSITAQPGSTLNIAGLSWQYYTNSTQQGAQIFRPAYSFDQTSANFQFLGNGNVTPTGSFATVTYPVNVVVPTGGTIYFRIYGHDAWV
jgi:hypothetical protein